MSMGTRQEVVERLRRKYQGAGPAYRRSLINELCSVGGYERKYAIKVLNGNRPGPRGRRRGGSDDLLNNWLAARRTLLLDGAAVAY
jgi:hypothetical protein